MSSVRLTLCIVELNATQTVSFISHVDVTLDYAHGSVQASLNVYFSD